MIATRSWFIWTLVGWLLLLLAINYSHWAKQVHSDMAIPNSVTYQSLHAGLYGACFDVVINRKNATIVQVGNCIHYHKSSRIVLYDINGRSYFSDNKSFCDSHQHGIKFQGIPGPFLWRTCGGHGKMTLILVFLTLSLPSGFMFYSCMKKKTILVLSIIITVLSFFSCLFWATQIIPSEMRLSWCFTLAVISSVAFMLGTISAHRGYKADKEAMDVVFQTDEFMTPRAIEADHIAVATPVALPVSKDKVLEIV